MENIIGWSLSDVKTYCELIGLKLDVQGYGYVVSQSINAGEVIDLNNMMLSVTLENKKD